MVALVFRTTGAWGAGQGFNLTNVQVDTNFYNLKLAVEAMVDTPAECISIESFEVIGNSLYIHLTDYSVQGPFVLPETTYAPQGVWLPSTPYLVNDLVSFGGTLYIVTFAHTSGTVFDPGANDGAGNNYYKVFFTAPETAFPVGGNTRQVLGKLSATDFDFGWITGLVPDGGTADQVLAKNSSGNQDTIWRSLSAISGTGLGGLTIKTVSVANYTFALGDENLYIRFTVSGSLQLAVPTNAVAAFGVGTEITFRITTATTVFITVTGVTVTPPTGFQFKPFGPGAVVTIKKTGTNTWDAFGLLLPV